MVEVLADSLQLVVGRARDLGFVYHAQLRGDVHCGTNVSKFAGQRLAVDGSGVRMTAVCTVAQNLSDRLLRLSKFLEK
jgi:hypothetical protein